MAARMKQPGYSARTTDPYFWRTTQQQEIDLVEESDGRLAAYEFKWGNPARAKFPQTFTHNYPDTKTQVISPANFEDFLLEVSP